MLALLMTEKKPRSPVASCCMLIHICVRASVCTPPPAPPLSSVITACPTPQETSCLHPHGLLAVTPGGRRPSFAMATAANLLAYEVLFK